MAFDDFVRLSQSQSIGGQHIGRGTDASAPNIVRKDYRPTRVRLWTWYAHVQPVLIWIGLNANSLDANQFRRKSDHVV